MEGQVMDMKEQISKIVEEVTKNPSIKAQFEKEPVKVIEKVIGVDLPDDAINQVVQGVKAKLTADKISGSVEALTGLFKK